MFYSIPAKAQNGYGNLFEFMKSDSASRHVLLPVWDKLAWSDTAITIKNQDQFNVFFKDHDLNHLPEIDFAKEYLALNYSCTYCGSSCNHAHGICHRNACNRNPYWVARKK